MELWIRSQLKGCLIKVNDLRIMQLDKDNFRALIEEEAVDGWNIVANDDPCIGHYKTKERALEVLDEIQKLLTPKMIIKNEGGNCVALDGTIYRTNIVSNIDSGIQQLSTIVYEMPKE